MFHGQADRDCLITFAATALCCDNTVRDHEMGYHQGGGTAYITAKGVMRRTGLSRTAAEHALRRLETAWRGQTRVSQHRMANQCRHARNAPAGRRLTPPDQHHGMPSAQTPDIDAAHHTISDYLPGVSLSGLRLRKSPEQHGPGSCHLGFGLFECRLDLGLEFRRFTAGRHVAVQGPF